ncbi:MAG: hypothetical protein LH473_10010 [Chitinophagales bacterium]|nr:hypothetical protein [Chitinophagales bacterium]
MKKFLLVFYLCCLHFPRSRVSSSGFVRERGTRRIYVFRSQITNRGYSNLNIETSQMENGIYRYSLIADGKVIDTKQMVKQH